MRVQAFFTSSSHTPVTVKRHDAGSMMMQDYFCVVSVV